MGTVRWTYNQCLIAIEKVDTKWNKKDLRARCINVVNFKNDTKLKWVIETPYPIRDGAMRDLLKGYSSNFASNKQFKMKFRSKKDPRQSIVIHFQHWGSSPVSLLLVQPSELRTMIYVLFFSRIHFISLNPK
ncbi:hypothetical protein Glove_262g34 [Diversispora epigaea]|uniref:Transposase putative helix-turn-helix domain-containing protein n=1 Tax=Diversispora epigaea TaxID=1348612 RepID=A0A397I5R6_9GLOM|nr:hypothetical protein Glove_262g34 [Diversispora epigaea]